MRGAWQRQVTTLAAAGGRTAAEARGRLQLMLRCGGRSLLTSAQRAVTEGVPASRCALSCGPAKHERDKIGSVLDFRNVTLKFLKQNASSS